MKKLSPIFNRAVEDIVSKEDLFRRHVNLFFKRYKEDPFYPENQKKNLEKILKMEKSRKRYFFRKKIVLVLIFLGNSIHDIFRGLAGSIFILEYLQKI